MRHAILSKDPRLVTALLRGQLFTEFFTGASEMVREWISDLRSSRTDMSTDLMIE